MTLWALADLHLAFGAPDKSMEFFGPTWQNYAERIEKNWRALVQKDDLVLIPGDISWALKLENALIDLRWIDALPGTKLLLRGNHDLWWPSASKLKELLPPSIHFIQNNVFNWNDVTIGGTRLWDSEEYGFSSIIEFQENPKERINKEEKPSSETIFVRELGRLELSLKALSEKAKWRIAMTHYPPIGLDLAPSRASKVFEKYQVETVVFGHLHNVQRGKDLFGKARGVNYHLTSCDYLDFIPLKIL